MSDMQIVDLDERPPAPREPWRAGSLTVALVPIAIVALLVALAVPRLASTPESSPAPTAVAVGTLVPWIALPIPIVPPVGATSTETGDVEVLETQRWIAVGSAYSVRGDVAEGVLGGYAYVIAGTGTADDGRHVYRYDVHTGERERAADLPVSLDHAMAATLRDRIYVFGGYVFGRASARVFSLGANDAAWGEEPPMPEARAAGGAAVVGERVYIVGGVGASGDWIRDTWAYDTNGHWSTDLKRIPTPRDHLAVGAYRGLVCAAGGDGANQAFECFDPVKNEWVWMPELRRPVVGGRAVEAAGWFFIVAQDVHVFTLDHWHFAPRLNAPRAGHALVAIDGTLYVIEGAVGRANGRMEMLRPQP